MLKYDPRSHIRVQFLDDRIKILFASAARCGYQKALGVFMNLRCAICCLNMESPRKIVMDRSARSLWRYIYARNLSFPLARAPPLRCSFPYPFVAFLFSPTPSPAASLPRLVNLDPGNAAKEGRAEGRRCGEGCKRKEGAKGKEKREKRRLKYHEDIIRYRRVVYPYRHPPYDPYIKQPSILIHDDGSTTRRDATRPAENRAESS